MGFRLLPKSVNSNDLEQYNGPYTVQHIDAIYFLWQLAYLQALSNVFMPIMQHASTICIEE